MLNDEKKTIKTKSASKQYYLDSLLPGLTARPLTGGPLVIDIAHAIRFEGNLFRKIDCFLSSQRRLLTKYSMVNVEITF